LPHGKTKTQKRRGGLKTTRLRNSSAADHKTQSVIAQLTRERDEALEQQAATAEVLKVISSSPGELEPVFQTMLANAVRICEAKFGNLWLYDGDAFRTVAMHGAPPAWVEWRQREPLIRPGPLTGLARIVRTKEVVHTPDIRASQGYLDRDPLIVATAECSGARTLVVVPMLKEDNLVGGIVIYRQEVRPFSDKQIALVQSFAAQAVIAIENARLFDEIQDKSRQLAEASQHKSQFLANMSHELRTPLNAILGYTELILDKVYGDTPDKMRGVLDRIERNGRHLLGLINDVLDLSKIEAGQLVLALGDYSLKNVVHTVFSAVEPLANEKKLAFKVDVAPDLPPGHGDERRLTQVLLNLVGNAIKFTDIGEVVIKASVANGSFNVAVRDTGPGISERDQAKLFQEFQQADNSITRKKGGTGLGLAISKGIIEMHGGKIGVDSTMGQGSTFSLHAPRHGRAASEHNVSKRQLLAKIREFLA
jgi:signal transduction histidine kinase